MLIRKAALLGVFIFHAAPTLAQTQLQAERRSGPKTLTAFEIGAQPVEIMAVTRRARADSEFDRYYIDDCETMAKVYPGYPQPALVTFDVRFQF
jgi:hypothetical protein